MAARSDAAAAPGPKDGAFMSFNVVCSSPNIVDLPPIHKEFSPEHIYDCQSLLDIGNAYKHELSPVAAEKLQGLCLLLKPDLNIPDSAIQLNRLTCYRADRDTALSGKTVPVHSDHSGGGLCVYINKEWCNNAAVVSKHCSPLVEFMFVKCRPFYLPREFTAIVIVAVYIPPCANAKDMLRELYSAISEHQTNSPDGFFIIAGDFNHTNLMTVLPKFYQHVNFATRGNNTLDFVYTTENNAYKAVPRPHLGY